MEVGGQGRDPAALLPGKRLGPDFTGGWIDHRPSARIHPLTIQLVASLYTDWAILAHFNSFLYVL
jgi:hypothetical protein